MRRIEQYTRELPYEQRCVIISKRDYRLLRAVARAVEKYQADGQWTPVVEAMDALNASERCRCAGEHLRERV